MMLYYCTGMTKSILSSLRITHDLKEILFKAKKCWAPSTTLFVCNHLQSSDKTRWWKRMRWMTKMFRLTQLPFCTPQYDAAAALSSVELWRFLPQSRLTSANIQGRNRLGTILTKRRHHTLKTLELSKKGPTIGSSLKSYPGYSIIYYYSIDHFKTSRYTL